jgi:hypothetical protein
LKPIDKFDRSELPETELRLHERSNLISIWNRSAHANYLNVRCKRLQFANHGFNQRTAVKTIASL